MVVASLLGRILGTVQGIHSLAIPSRLSRAMDEKNLQCPLGDSGDVWTIHVLRLTIPLRPDFLHMGYW